MIVKDHFLTGEFFEIKTISKGVMSTFPKIDHKKLKPYYNSKRYYSHNTTNSIMSLLYSWSSRFMTKKKIKLISSTLKNKGSLLDFGCGKGDFLLAAKKRGFEVAGVEFVSAVHKELNKKKIKFYEKIEQLPKAVSAITFWHSFEHLNDLNQTLILSRKNLKDRGMIVIAVPNYDSFDSKYYKSFWAAFDAPRHRFHFNKKGLINTVQKHGFKHLYTKPMFLDAVYISILSEKYKGNKMYFINGFFIGLFSNFIALFTKQYSSNIFIFKKTD